MSRTHVIYMYIYIYIKNPQKEMKEIVTLLYIYIAIYKKLSSKSRYENEAFNKYIMFV